MSNEKERKIEEKENLAKEVKDMKMDYKNKLPGVPEISDKAKEEMEKTRKEMENFQKKVVKKYPFTIGIGIIPPQASDKFEEEEIPDPALLEKIKKEKPVHIVVLIPEEKFKDMVKIKEELVKMVEGMKPKVWIHIKTPVDVWNYGLDGKYDILSAIGLAFPLYDNGFLGALRVAEIHKSLVLRKFEKYVVSYVIAGSLVRGEATKTSDVDVFCIIDDTDVKRMHRLELKEKLRGIINSYVLEAGELAGVKNKLSIQVYILTEFWESVKDAHPVMFTFIRDGVAMYDRGTFMPWKLLLKMGKLKPSPEAIDMFMSMGDKTVERAKRTLMDIFAQDIFWGVTTPAQAILMLSGLPPPNAKKELVPALKQEFLEKHMIEKKYVDFVEKVVTIWRDYEHERIKEISGKEIDEMLKETADFLKRMKELRLEVEKKIQEKTIDEIYKNVFDLLKGIFGDKSEEKLIDDFKKNFIKTGKLPGNYLKVLEDIEKAKKEVHKGKTNLHEVDNARKNASILINFLIEFNQRCEMAILQKGRLRLKAGEKVYELIITNNKAYFIDNGNISKINVEHKKMEKSSIDELNNSIEEQKKIPEVIVDEEIFSIIRKEIGKFEIIF